MNTVTTIHIIHIITIISIIPVMGSSTRTLNPALDCSEGWLRAAG